MTKKAVPLICWSCIVYRVCCISPRFSQELFSHICIPPSFPSSPASPLPRPVSPLTIVVAVWRSVEPDFQGLERWNPHRQARGPGLQWVPGHLQWAYPPFRPALCRAQLPLCVFCSATAPHPWIVTSCPPPALHHRLCTCSCSCSSFIRWFVSNSISFFFRFSLFGHLLAKMPLEQTVYIVNNSGKIISSVRALHHKLLCPAAVTSERGWAGSANDIAKISTNTQISRASSCCRYSRRPRHPTRRRRPRSRESAPCNDHRPLRLGPPLHLTDWKITTKKRTRTTIAVTAKVSLVNYASTKIYTRNHAAGPTMQSVMLVQDAATDTAAQNTMALAAAASKGRPQLRRR